MCFALYVYTIVLKNRLVQKKYSGRKSGNGKGRMDIFSGRIWIVLMMEVNGTRTQYYPALMFF